MEHPIETYIAHIFGNDGTRGWNQYFDDRAEEDILEAHLEKSPELELEVLHTAFTHKKKGLSGYSPYQVSNALDYIFNPSLSNLGFCFQNETLNQKKRLETISALFRVFSFAFNDTAEPILVHIGQAVTNPINEHLNATCYMFWDTACIPYNCGENTILTCLDVMKKCTMSPNIAVVESAIHGLGHMIGHSKGHDDSIRRAIDGANFGFNAQSDLLRIYADAAKQGMIS